jgi:nitrate/TMAO reductase-like tetraheme cytochrome c subunit
MNSYKITFLGTALLLLSLTCVSCKNNKEEQYHSITDKIEAKSKDYQGVSVSSDGLLEGENLIEISEDGHTFLIPERKSQMKSYACTECHTKPLTDMQKNSEIGKKAHWDIKLIHANEDIMNCITCHSGSSMDNLHSLTGKSIDFNASYKLCVQCHANQFEDWKGGAHGKKVAGWAPPRASMTCVNCHNPHNPKFKSKWPERYNTQTIKDRKETLGH